MRYGGGAMFAQKTIRFTVLSLKTSWSTVWVIQDFLLIAEGKVIKKYFWLKSVCNPKYPSFYYGNDTAARGCAGFRPLRSPKKYSFFLTVVITCKRIYKSINFLALKSFSSFHSGSVYK